MVLHTDTFLSIRLELCFNVVIKLSVIVREALMATQAYKVTSNIQIFSWLELSGHLLCDLPS